MHTRLSVIRQGASYVRSQVVMLVVGLPPALPVADGQVLWVHKVARTGRVNNTCCYHYHCRCGCAGAGGAAGAVEATM